MNHRPFDKQQLISIVDTLMVSAMDALLNFSSDLSPDQTFPHTKGCVSTVNHTLSTLFTKLTGNSIEVDTGFRQFVGDYIMTDKQLTMCDIRPIAVKFVNTVFDEYLKNIPAAVCVTPDAIPYCYDMRTHNKKIPTNRLNCEEVFVETCKALYNDDHGNDFESWICELADAEEFSIDLAMCVTSGEIKFPVSMGSEQEILVKIN